jgi:hypothetical protein
VFCYAFLVVKRLNAKDIHKQMFFVYGGECLLHKVVHIWVKKKTPCGKRCADEEEVEMEVWKWLRQHSDSYFAAGFVTLIQRWDKCISVGGGYVEK